jgi:hypothetical protein
MAATKAAMPPPEAPAYMCCPIAGTGETMRDPVLLMGSGHTYERRVIEAALARSPVDPLTGESSAA